MTLTPLDVEKVEFPTKVFGGYDRDAVHEFLDDVIATLSQYIKEREDLKERVARQNEELEGWRAKEHLVSDSVQLAQKTRDQVIGSAQAEADAMLREARLESMHIRNELAALRADKESFEFEFYGLLKGFTEKLERRNPALVAEQGYTGKTTGAAGRDASPTGAPEETK